jgi:acetyl esterase/lipase
VLVYLHGGAWWTGGLGGFNAEGQTFPFFLSNGRIFREELAAGWAVVDVDYGLSVLPTDAGHVTLLDELQNVKTAIATLRALAGTGTGQLHIDPDKVVVGGESAGGTLAVLTGMTPGLREPAGVTATTVQGVVDLDGPTDLVAFQRCTHHNDFDLSQLITTTDPLKTETDTRFGAPTNHPTWRDSLPAAMNCPNGTFGAPAPPAGADPMTVDPIAPECQALLDANLPSISPYQILQNATATQIESMAPMYLACSTPGTPNFPADLNCAAQEVPFMQLAHNLTGSYPVEVDETQGWHPDIGDHLNNQQLEAFIDQCVAGQP